ncbi:response regulator [Cohnella sp. AR92]|uniref:response regulator n=1 Tax=Cohnella sp. AR92 TaxID=648716 RepID=UPI001315903F|nr:response regulator [Cohnella sp. AR92]
MRTLLIVDDEPRQVKSLSAIINRRWPEYRVLEATDAESAWGLIKREPVDAVLTDIRMPDVDGLTLIERIAERSNRIKTVLISGYGQFDYAQRAIKLQVVEYLVKPIGLGDIERVIGKLENLFAKEHTLHLSESVYQEQLWNAWIGGTIDDSQKRELMKTVPADGPGLVMSIELPQSNVPMAQEGAARTVGTNAADNQQLLEAKENWSLLAKSLGHTVCFLDSSKRRIVSLVWLDRPFAARPSETISRVSRLFEKLRGGGMEHAILGVSAMQPQLGSSLAGAYENSVLALKHRFYLEHEAIVWGTDIRPFASGGIPRLRELAEPLSTAVRAIERAKAMAIANELFQIHRQETASYPDPASLSEQLSRLADQVADDLHRLAPEEADRLSDAASIRAEFDTCASYQELRSRFKKFIESLLELSARARQDKNGLLLLRCQSYLQEHYMEDLSLDAVAQMYHFNPSYFSTLFKQKTGVNFSDYLLDLRIRQAERLLERSDDKISDISERVGFRNSTYFNRMFKRMTGFSPNAYRQMRSSGKAAER